MGLEFDPKEVILKHKEGVEVIPANKLLAGLDVALINVEDREKVLKEYLGTLEEIMIIFLLTVCLHLE